MTMCSSCADTALPVPGLPIRESTDQKLFNASPWLFAVVHALHRLLVPRHPPCALDILTVIKPSSRSSIGSMKSNSVRDPPLIDRGSLASCAVFKVRKRSDPQGTPADGLSKLSSAPGPVDVLGPLTLYAPAGPEWSP